MSAAERLLLVTGADRPASIGAAIGRALASEGARLLLTLAPDAPPDADGGAGVRDAAPDRSCVTTLLVDLAEPGAAEAVLAAARSIGPLTTLIGCAAVSERDGVDGLTEAGLDAAWAVNVRAHAMLAQGLLRQLPDGTPGRIVLFTSGHGLGAMPDELAYATSKGAVEAFTISLAPAAARRNVTINAIDPGPVDTGWMAEGDRQAAVRPGGEVAAPDAVVPLVRFLLSDAARDVTGQVVRSRGGL